MKIQQIIISVILSAGACNCLHAGNIKMSFDRLHKKLDKVLDQAATDAKSLFKKGSNLITGSSQAPLTLDIEEINGVKLIKGLKRDNQIEKIVNQLFWCKQNDLVAFLQQNFELGSTQLRELILQRDASKQQALIRFMQEIVHEYECLDECAQSARKEEVARVQELQATLDGLLEGLAKALGI
ncbi:hypothetical protein JST56_06340 [Candidatus Dependentiae bacterium]|nr:hypothetical protein [Candidatus Dependentiae bacterium]